MLFKGWNKFCVLLAFLFYLNIALAGGVETRPSPWMIYVGGFGGYYTSDFLYQSRESAPELLSPFPIQALSEDTFQQGGLGGGQIGVQYHLADSIYFLGLAISGSSNGRKAQLSLLVFPFLPGANFLHRFQDRVDWDFSGIFGFDLTQRTHLYSKLGAAFHRFKHQLITEDTATGTGVTILTPGYFPEHRKYWNTVVGLGFTYDLNRWLNAFIEYDFYSYKTKILNTLQNFAFLSVDSVPMDTMTQKIWINASSIRVGFNLKFLDAVPLAVNWEWPASWIVYLGAFAGMTSTDFQYQAQYSLIVFPDMVIKIFNNDIFQQGFSGGGQIGVQYHLASPYFFGLVSSIVRDGRKAYLSQLTNLGFFPTQINPVLQVKHHGDIALIAGADITPCVHLYGKLGRSFTRLQENIFEIIIDPFFPAPPIPHSENHTFWGWTLGLGLSRDVNRWLNIFAEYNLNAYNQHALRYYQNLIMPIPDVTGPNQLAQQARLIENSVRVGINIQWRDALPADEFYSQNVRPWTIYLGGFTGYYNADFQYSAYSQGDAAQQFYHNDTFQYGASGGGQIGIQYHFQAPYFIGLTALGMANGHHSQLIVFDFSSAFIGGPFFTITNQFRIRSNWDFAALVGTDFTPTVHAYAKIGVSRAKLSHFIGSNFILLTDRPFFQNNKTLHTSGLTFGVGTSHDWNRWLNSFIEYNYYGYRDKELTTLHNTFFELTDLLTQHMRPTAWTVLLGLNLTFQF